MDWPILKTLDISVCQTSENKAFKMQHSVTVVRPLCEREHDLISSPHARVTVGVTLSLQTAPTVITSKSLHTAICNLTKTRLCNYQRPSWGVDPGDMRGNRGNRIFGPGRGHWTAFALPRQDTRAKTHGICNIATILKMKDPYRGMGTLVYSPV